MIAGGMVANGRHGELSSDPLKIKVKKGEDDDSTAAISESECSSFNHGHTELLVSDATISSPKGDDRKSRGKCRNDSGSASSKFEDAQNLEVVAGDDLAKKPDKEVEPCDKEVAMDKDVVSKERVVGNLGVDRVKGKGGIELADTVIIEAEQHLNERHGEITSKVDVSGTEEECTQNCNNENEKKDRKKNSQSLTLAQRMKEMFDSSSPHQPSNAFGKGGTGTRSAVNLDPPKPASLAKEMKKMFESPSRDEPSRAFSVEKTRVQKLKDANSIARLSIDAETSLTLVEGKAEPTKPTSPASVADQMVSMLWALSSSSKESMMNKSGATEQVGNTKIFIGPNFAVIRETAIEEGDDSDEDIEEITLEDEDGNDVTISDDQYFEDIIEEITVEDEEEREDEISVTTNEEFFKSKACIDVSPDFVAMVEKEVYDGCSYDEITSDDWEYDEKTVDEEVSQDNNEKDVKPGEEGLPAVSPQTVSMSTKIRENHHFDRSKVEKLNPRLAMNPSRAGKIAEKLKMFDSMKPMEGQQSLAMTKQKSNPRDESNKALKTDNGIFSKTPIVLPTLSSTTKQMQQSGEKTLGKSGYSLEDNALVEQIISLVREPGAMQNKDALATRIISLLTGIREDAAKTSPLIQPFHLAPSKSYNSLRNNQLINARSSLPPKNAPSPPSDSKYAREANSSLNRKNDKFIDPGIKQMRKDVKAQKEKVKHIEDPDTPENRRTKPITITDQKVEVGKPTKMAPGFLKKNVDPEEIMARIWPKTPRGENNQPKALSKSKAPDKSKTTPRKLGSRFKKFESRSSSESTFSETVGCFEKNVMIEPQNQFSITKTSSNKVEVNGGRNQISEKTVRRLVIFQRIWRKRDSKSACKNAPDRGVTAPKIEGVFITTPKSKRFNNGGTRAKPNPSQINLGDDPVQASISTSEASRIPSKCPNSSDSDQDCCYSLEEFERGSFDTSIVDMERWEEFLSDESFYEHFGLTKVEFYQQPKWKRNNQKRKVRVAF